MPDHITLKDQGGDFKPHPEGQFGAVCVDVIDLGDRVRDFEGHVTIKPSLAIVFATGERRDDGKPATVSREFTASMHPNSSLRPFLEGWRGKKYTNQEVKENGIPIHKMVGVPALLTVENETSRLGREYALISSCVPLPKQMLDEVPDMEMLGYERANFWQDKRETYRAEVVSLHNGGNGDMEDDGPPPGDEEVPF